MEQINMTVQVRENAGKGVARSLRREGRIPGVLYGLQTVLPLSTDKKGLLKMLNGPGGVEHSLLNLTVEGASENASRWAVIKDFQVDPVRNELLHVDFLEVSLEKKIRIGVPIEFEGTAIGVKMGGILQRLLREIEVECLPQQMPGTFVVSISNLASGKTLHASDIPMPDGVTLVTPAAEAVVTVVEPRAAAAEGEEAAAGEGGAAAVPAEGAGSAGASPS